MNCPNTYIVILYTTIYAWTFVYVNRQFIGNCFAVEVAADLSNADVNRILVYIEYVYIIYVYYI